MALTRIRAEQISDIDYKQAVRVITVANVTLSGGAPSTVDGVNLSVNNRVLVTGQSTPSQNGIYIVQTLGTGSNGTWVRSSDANQTGEIEAGMIVMVTEGTSYADTQWLLTTNNPIVVGTTPLNFVQNSTSTANIISGTSSVRVLNDSNVLISVAGVPNVAVFYNDGLSLTGNLDVSKDVVVTGNLTVNGTTTTINSNVITTNDKNITLANNQSTSANIDGAGIAAGSPAVATFFYNDATTSWQSNVNLTPTGNATLNLGAETNLWANVYANNLSAHNAISATTISAFGNVTGGNLLTTGQVSAGGNVTAGNVSTAGLISAAGNVTAGNLTTTGAISAASAVIGNILPPANVTYDLGSPTQQWRTLYVSGNTIFIGDSTITSNATSVTLTNPSGAAFSVTGNSPGNSVGIFGAVSTTGNVNASGNVNSGNITTTGLVSAAGNITGNYILGNGSQLTGLGATYTDANVTSLLSNLGANVISSAGNITTTANISGGYLFGNGSQITGLPPGYSNADVATYLASGTNTSNIVTSGNVTGGNFTTTGLVSVAGNITAGNVAATNLTGTLLTAAQPNVTSVGTLGNLSVAGNIDSANVIATNLTGTLLTAAQNNITSVGTLSSLSVSGNIVGGNVLGNINATSLTGTTVSVTGNVVGGNIVSSGTISTTGTGIFGAGLSVVGNITATGNINYQNVTDLVVGDPLIYLGANNTSNLVDLGFVASYNNGTYYHTGLARNYTNGVWTFFDGVVAEPTTVIDWANATYPTVKTGPLTSTASVSAAGNITGNFFFGNAAYMTGIPASYSNTDVANYLASGTDTSNIITTANVQGAYVIGNGSALTSITGANVTGQVPNALVAGTVYTNAQPNITSVGTLDSVTVSGNVVGGNLNLTGNIVDTGALSIVTGSNGNIALAPNGTGIVTVSTNISAVGNITGSFYFGNGSQLTGVQATPGGATTQIQYNNGGVFAGSANLTFDGTSLNAVDNPLLRAMLKDSGYVYFNSGTTNALNFVNGPNQRWAPNTGSQTLSITNWPPSGNLGELLIEGVNLGSSTITWPTINWIQPSGITTTNINTYLSAISRSLQTNGIDWVLLWTRDAGTTIYGKLM